jgi:hypothetical protein
VNLHAVEARRLAYRRRGCETLDDVLDLVRRQLTRRCRTGEVQGHRAWRDGRVPERERVRLPPWMIDLHQDRNACVLGGLGPARQCVKVALVLDDDVARLTELRAIDHHVAGDDQAVPTAAPAGVEPLQPLVGGVALIAEPFAQRGLHDPVRKHQAAGQFQGVVQ